MDDVKESPPEREGYIRTRRTVADVNDDAGLTHVDGLKVQT